MGGDVVGGVNKNKSGEISNIIHELILAVVINNFARVPDIETKNIKEEAEVPRKDKLFLQATVPLEAIQCGE